MTSIVSLICPSCLEHGVLTFNPDETDNWYCLKCNWHGNPKFFEVHVEEGIVHECAHCGKDIGKKNIYCTDCNNKLLSDIRTLNKEKSFLDIGNMTLKNKITQLQDSIAKKNRQLERIYRLFWRQ